MSDNWRSPGQIVLRRVVRKRSPKPVESLSPTEVLHLMGIPPTTATKLVDYCDGDLFKLMEMDTNQLESIPGVGEAITGRFVAMNWMLNKWVRKRRPAQ